MKNFGIYSRILLMLILTGIILLFLFSVLFFIKNKQEKLMIEESQKQFDTEINTLFTFKTATLKQVAFDYTYWDDFVENMKIKDTAWFNNNITTILKSFRIDYACVYDTAFNLIHEASSNEFVKREFIFKETLVKLKNVKFLNFFQAYPDEAIEISSATIHPNNDPTHTLTRPSGYLVLAKSWNQSFFHDLTLLSGAEVNLLKSSDSTANSNQYSISSLQKLQGWDNEPVAQILFTRTINSYKLYHNLSVYMLLIILCSILITLLIFHFTTRKWINKPLKLVENILKSNNLTLIKELQHSPGEFKQIGYLFNEFIKQKDELKHAKIKAEESDCLKSAFLANMSHEIRTPMNGILGFAGLLAKSDLTSEKQNEYLQIIENSGKRMLNIINDIIDISKIESGQMELYYSETNINEQMEYLHIFFKPEAEKKGIQISFKNSLSANEAIIKTDKEKVYAILTNLVKNAIKFTSKGFIEFGYVKKDQYLEFFVKDTGIGISEKHKSIIFERFRQGSESVAPNYEGTGLGLSISKAYVEMLGGKIWVESEQENLPAGQVGGSTFYFIIPYNTKPEEKDVDNNIVLQDEKTTLNTNLKILIAEDEKTSEKLISILTEKFSKEVLFARNGFEAVEVCRNNPDIDLVLMDVKMPEMNGYEATQQIRLFNKKVIIIAQTAYALSGENEKATEAGCNDYISKPILNDELYVLIQKYFKK